MKYLLTTLTLIGINFSYAQNINWSTMDENQKNLTYLNSGYDFGVITQIGYGYLLERVRPILLTTDYSFPMGKNLIDDFKIRLGGQVQIYEINNFIVSAKIYGNFRRHQTKFVRMASFGSETAIVMGYYKPKWHIAGELGFDKSIVTHLKHSDLMRENFASISDGWFIPSGGHLIFGIQGSRAISDNFEISLRLGGTTAQFKDVNPILPYYGQLGLVYKFSRKE